MKRRVSKKTYKKCFLILTVVFVVMFVAEFISVLVGNPITEIHITGIDLERDVMGIKLLRAFISACFIGGMCNVFLTVKVIKESRCIDRLPTVIVIIMTVIFPLEVIVSQFLVVPTMIFWGIKAFTGRGNGAFEKTEYISEETETVAEDNI